MSVAHSQGFGFMEATPAAQTAFAPCHGADEEPSLPHIEVNCPAERKNPNQTSLSVQLCCTTVILNFSPSGSEQTQARKPRKSSLNPLA